MISNFILIYFAGIAVLLPLIVWRGVFAAIPLGLRALLLWAHLLLLLYFFDYFELNPAIAQIVLLLIVVAVTWRTRRTAGPGEPKWGDVMKLLGFWSLNFGAVSLFLLVCYPKGTLVPGHFVCNDSVHHSFMAKGFHLTRIRPLEWDFSSILEVYPRAFHSFLFVLSNGVSRDPIELFFPGVVLMYSLLSLAVFENAAAKGFLRSLFISLAALSVPLGMTIVSLGFAAQVGCICFILGTVRAGMVLRVWPPRSWGEREYAFLVFALAGVALYGAFTVVILPAAFLAIVLARTVFAADNSPADDARKFDKKKFVLAALTLAFLAIVPVWNTLALILGQLKLPEQSQLAFSKGNLLNYISPLHLSGFWPFDSDYRFGPESQRTASILLFLLLLKFAFILRGGKPTYFGLTAILMSVVALAGPLFFGPYPTFKLLTIASIFVSLSFAESALSASNRLGQIGGAALMLLAVSAQLWSSSRTLFTAATFTSDEWRSIQQLKRNYLDKGPSFVVSREDWISYAVDNPDDFVPETIYLRRRWKDEPIRFVAFDSYYEKEWEALAPAFNQELKLARTNAGNCIRTTVKRFQVLDRRCLGKNS